MTPINQYQSKLSIALSGNMTQFTIVIVSFLFALIFSLMIIISKTSGLFLYISSGIIGLLFIVTIICPFFFYLQLQKRASQDVPSELEVKSPNGKSIKLINPTDNIYSKEELHAIMRYCMVSFDENLCPSGEVLGHASDGNYRSFSEEEQKEFIKKHIEEIKGKKNAIIGMYNTPLQIDDRQT